MRDFGTEVGDDRGGDGLAHDRLIALFFCGAVAFHPLLVEVFDKGATTTVFGVPILLVYLFVAWAGLIALMRWTVGRDRAAPRSRTGGPGAGGRDRLGGAPGASSPGGAPGGFPG